MHFISTVLGQVDHGGQNGNADRTRAALPSGSSAYRAARIRDETSETDHTQNDAFALVLFAEP